MIQTLPAVLAVHMVYNVGNGAEWAVMQK